MVTRSRAGPEVILTNLAREPYPDPLEYDTAESFARYHHLDIPALDDVALEDELLLARIRRAADYITRQPASAWLCERIERIEAEAARRRRTVRR
jgi:hypothetical protein